MEKVDEQWLQESTEVERLRLKLTAIDRTRQTVEGEDDEGHRWAFRYSWATRVRRLTPVETESRLDQDLARHPLVFPLHVGQLIVVAWKPNLETGTRWMVQVTIP